MDDKEKSKKIYHKMDDKGKSKKILIYIHCLRYALAMIGRKFTGWSIYLKKTSKEMVKKVT